MSRRTLKQKNASTLREGAVPLAEWNEEHPLKAVRSNDPRLTADLSAYVPTNTTLTGTAPIQIDGSNSPQDLSANRTISIDTSGLPLDSLTGDGTFGPQGELDVFHKTVYQIFSPGGTKVASDSYFSPTGSGNTTVVYVNGRSYLQHEGAFNAGGQDMANATNIYPWETVSDFYVDYRTGPNIGDCTNTRLWAILEDHASAETYMTDDPLPNKVIGFRFSNSTAHGAPGIDTTWMAYCSDGTNSTATTTGVTPAVNTSYEMYIDMSTKGTAYFWINRALVATISTHVPVTGNCQHRFTVEGNSGAGNKYFLKGKFLVRFK